MNATFTIEKISDLQGIKAKVIDIRDKCVANYTKDEKHNIEYHNKNIFGKLECLDYNFLLPIAKKYGEAHKIETPYYSDSVYFWYLGSSFYNKNHTTFEKDITYCNFLLELTN